MDVQVEPGAGGRTRPAGLAAPPPAPAPPAPTAPEPSRVLPPGAGLAPAGPGERLAVAGAVVALLLYAVWRVPAGARLSDDGHVIALALRLAQGDRPFADEMNVQVLGSVWAAPLAWLWTHVVGLGGLVLASRAYFVVLALGVGVLAYRALRVSFGPVVAAVAVAVPLLCPPYDLLSVSYSTSPVLGVVLAVCAAHAALMHPVPAVARRWAAVAGAALAAGVFSNPLVLGGGVAVVVAVVVLGRSRPRDVLLPFLLTLGTVTAAALLWLAGIGPDALLTTLDYTRQTRYSRLALPQRLAAQYESYHTYVWQLRFLPVPVLAVAALVPGLPRRARAVLLALLPLAAIAPSAAALRSPGSGSAPPMGVLPAVVVVLLVAVLAVPVAVRATRERRRDVVLLLALTVPAGVVAVPAVAAFTESSAVWGAALTGAAPAVTGVLAGWAALTVDAWRPVGLVAAGLVVLPVLALLTLTPFRDPAPWRLDARVPAGAFAGVRTTPATAQHLGRIQETAARWVRPGDGVLIYGLPGAYLLVDARVDSNIEWLADGGPANRATLDWIGRTGRRPGVVILDGGLLRQAGGLARLAQRDPLVAYLRGAYRQVQGDGTDGAPVVLVRD